jgi:hypothetical protein
MYNDDLYLRTQQTCLFSFSIIIYRGVSSDPLAVMNVSLLHIVFTGSSVRQDAHTIRFRSFYLRIMLVFTLLIYLKSHILVKKKGLV